jgi:hypothetical protein
MVSEAPASANPDDEGASTDQPTLWVPGGTRPKQ